LREIRGKKARIREKRVSIPGGATVAKSELKESQAN
jgi:hypothetical protein